MQVFKTALKIVFRSPIYLLIYIVFFGLLGLVMVGAVSDMLPSEASEASRDDLRPTLAIIDRDHSAISEGMTEFLTERSTPIALEDSSKTLQDATAQDLATYILIIPQGFGEDFLKAARNRTEPPLLETVVSFAKSDGILMDLLVNRYLQALRSAALMAPDSSTTQLLATAARAASIQTEVKSAPLTEGPSAAPKEVFYFLWIAFPVTLGLIVLTGTLFSTFRLGELRRRNLCAPLSSSKMNVQVALGSVSVVFMTWAFMILLSLLPVIGGMKMLLSSPLPFLLLALAILIYALVPFSLGFMLSQIGLKEAALNGAANILSLAFCFLSGIFMGGAAFLGDTMQSLAHVIPTYWYTEAVMSLTEGGLKGEVLSSYFGNLGVVVLFAAAFFSVALLISKRAAQSSDAGGNTAAESAI